MPATTLHVSSLRPAEARGRHRARGRRRILAVGLTLGLGVTAAGLSPAEALQAPEPRPVMRFANSLRGIDLGPGGTFLVARINGTYGLVTRRGPDKGSFTRLGRVPRSFLAPAVDHRAGTVYALSLPSRQPGGATLYRWTEAEGQVEVANIGRYQRRRDHDPYDLEKRPGESNPYGVAVLPDGGALVADAANNDVLHVTPEGAITTVARVKPRVVRVPRGLGPDAPPPGTRIPSEAVITSVAVGQDGYYYFGELRGFPATPGTSQIWRVPAGTTEAVCDPAKPRTGPCKRFATGLTSIVALEAGPKGAIYAVSLARQGWLKAETGPNPFATRGTVIRIAHDRSVRRALGRDRLVLPGDVAVDRRGRTFVTTPIFGPSRIMRVR